MIINFQLENWSCYRAESCLSMQAGPERDENSILAMFGDVSRPERVLPVVAIYGNNAAGKTQFVKAISFLRRFALGGYKHGSLPCMPFLLDKKSAQSPTRFTLQFLADETVFEYKVVLTASRVIREELHYYTSRGLVRHELFVRDAERVTVFDEWGGEAFRVYSKTIKLGPCQSYLALSHDLCRDEKYVRVVHDWFGYQLFVIRPETHYLGLEDFCATGVMQKMTIEYLNRFDVGIKKFEPKDVAITALPKRVIEELEVNLKPGKMARVDGDEGFFWVIKDSQGRLSVKKVFAVHDCIGKGAMPFPIDMESDGTRRMLDLIPAFMHLKSRKFGCIYVIDELDRSLHSKISRAFIEDFLKSCTPSNRSQLIFTTHDLMLMDQDLLRRDSMYLVDKSPDGESSLGDVRQFRGLRKGTNVRDVYLQGRLGGIARSLV